MKLRYHQVDAFTNDIFGGNYAGVILLKRRLNDQLMQQIATENNVSETAFVFEKDDGRFHIRWFSPLQEIDFCGHATLAAASVLFEQNVLAHELCFEAEAVGQIVVSQRSDGRIEMMFPPRPLTPLTTTPDGLFAALGHTPHAVLENRQAIVCVFDDVDIVRTLTPDIEALKSFAPLDVCVTAAGEKYDFESRYFWPANGGAEDPVTGSMHAGLAPYWAERLGKNTLMAFQASQRGGVLYCDVSETAVVVGGYTVKYLEGDIYLHT